MAWMIIWVEAIVVFLGMTFLGGLFVFFIGGRKLSSFVCSPMVGLAFVGLASLLSAFFGWSVFALAVEAVLVMTLILLGRRLVTRISGGGRFAVRAATAPGRRYLA